jgi:hypothetical protein
MTSGPIQEKISSSRLVGASMVFFWAPGHSGR